MYAFGRHHEKIVSGHQRDENEKELLSSVIVSRAQRPSTGQGQATARIGQSYSERKNWAFDTQQPIGDEKVTAEKEGPCHKKARRWQIQGLLGR